MLCQSPLAISAVNVSRLVLVVKQGPELEAGIGHRQADTVGTGQLYGFVEARVVVSVKDGPHRVVLSYRVPMPPTLLDRTDDDGLRIVAGADDSHLHRRRPDDASKCGEVGGLGLRALGDNEDARLGGSPWPPPREPS